MRLPLLLSTAASLIASTLAAQAPLPASVTAAAGTITADEVLRRIRVIADDSMLGRDTPSRGLDQTAAWVAGEFQRFGLKPGGENGTWFQRYPITRRKLEAAQSQLILRAGKAEGRTSFASGARLVAGTVPSGPVSGPVLLFGGQAGTDEVAHAPVKDKVVLAALNPGAPTTDQVIRALYLAGPRAVVLLSPLDSAGFAPRLAAQSRERTAIDLGLSRPPVLELREDAVAGPLKAAGIRPAEVRASRTAVVRDLPQLSATVDLKEAVVSSQTAPNTLGILEGTDPALKNEYLLFSAHMDHIGITPGQPDSVNNGADDDASGTVGVVELAEALSQPGARPKRSVLFLTVSGEEKGLWGSRYFSEHPTVPLKNVVADINIDMIGRNWPDTIVAIGKEHSNLGATLERVNAAHRELGMTAIDDRWPEERFYFRSDHYNFARKGVPILFFFNGVHEDYHRVTDSPDKINGEKESRILKLLFYLGQDIANASERPQWKPESYKEIVEQ
jgi:hypothetical protein